MDRFERYFHSLYETALAVNANLAASAALETIAKQATTAMEAKACSIRLLDAKSKSLEPKAFYGLSQGYLKKGPVHVDRSEVDREALGGRIVHIADVATDSRYQYPEAAKAEGIVSVVVCPLLVEGKPIGVLRVYADKARVFDRGDDEFLMAVATLCALAIQNARIHQALRRNYELLKSFELRTFED